MKLYAEITPLETTATNVYNKVMASIYPKTNGSPVSATIAAGQKVIFEVDLSAYVNNNGQKWGNSQQVKLVLSSNPALYADPHKNTSDMNSALTVTIRSSRRWWKT